MIAARCGWSVGILIGHRGNGLGKPGLPETCLPSQAVQSEDRSYSRMEQEQTLP